MIAPGPFLKCARTASGLTQAELAHRLETTQSTIARLESSGANPRFDTFQRAIAATGHSIEIELQASTYPSLDETMIISNLRKTPAERLRYFASAYRELRKLAPTVRQRSGSQAQASG